ncbi:hypothetical protein CARUB_v10024294mg [Capsella rubella]|uniref:Uncharacterized protein n=1 Tax=Capsella rubella TaxID=81985 RepID=R0HS02_9BRAS|nr:hypothetical protein CARUB_v10024294mg [Capsella rubella]
MDFKELNRGNYFNRLIYISNSNSSLQRRKTLKLSTPFQSNEYKVSTSLLLVRGSFPLLQKQKQSKHQYRRKPKEASVTGRRNKIKKTVYSRNLRKKRRSWLGIIRNQWKLQTAFRLVLHGELANHAVYKGTKAVTN